MAASEPPRISASFADFTRDEQQRHPLQEEPPICDAQVVEDVDVSVTVTVTAIQAQASPLKRRRVSKALRMKHSVTPGQLRAEGILEIGRAASTSVLFVRTRVKLHLLHVTWVPDRELDDYAVRLAVAWIEDQGHASYSVARDLGVSQDTLRKALVAAGYQRLTAPAQAALAVARSRRGNRRGRLARAPTSSRAHNTA